MNLKCLEAIRLSELDSILDEIKRQKPGQNIILEIGAGTGWQAKKISENGYVVEAIDIEDSKSKYMKQRVWPILNYDGRNIPFPTDYFDVVFSSNVLEHIAFLDEFQNEIKRVLKPDGIAIHVVPSGSWRFWSIMAHYPFIIKVVLRRVYNKMVTANDAKEYRKAEYGVKPDNQTCKVALIRNALFPARHGEKGNVLTEMFFLSRYRWIKLFERNGWKIDNAVPNRLFYTGGLVLGSLMPIRVRKYLSFLLGSSCHIFTLKKELSEQMANREGSAH